MRSITKSSQRRYVLEIEGRWKDLDEHFERTARPCRPFVWLHQKCLLPGNEETQHALFLFKQGRLEDALEKADRAIRQMEHKPLIFKGFYRSRNLKMLDGVLNARILILTGLGRCDEAREVAARVQRGKGVAP
jgi:hypothetical protein